MSSSYEQFPWTSAHEEASTLKAKCTVTAKPEVTLRTSLALQGKVMQSCNRHADINR